MLRIKAYNNMNQNEGIDHIRLDSDSHLSLGRELAIDATRVFYHPVYGTFTSIRNALLYLSLKNPSEELRGFTSKNDYESYVKSLTKEDYLPNRRLNDETLDSIITFSIMSSPTLLASAINYYRGNPLPLICYLTNKDTVYCKVVNIRYAKAVERVIEKISKTQVSQNQVN